MLKQLPALSRIYGIKPPDIDAMTTREVAEYLRDMDAMPAVATVLVEPK